MGNGTTTLRARRGADTPITFFQEFLRRPREVASVIPSSRFLEDRIVRVAALADSRMTVELGPGTGGTTRAVLDALPASSRLLAIDANRRFVSLLDGIADARLTPHFGRAEEIGEILDHHGLPRPDVVLSGIPFSTMSRASGERVLRAVGSVLAPGGCFVAYQCRARVAELARGIFGRPDVEIELLNVPPMRVFRWRKGGARADGR